MLGNKLQQPYDLDNIDDYPVVIDSEHHKIHEGVHYACQDYDTDVDSAAPKYWHIITPDTTTRMHFTFNLIAAKSGTVELFENPTTTDNGSALTACNNDRNSANTATLTCYYDPTVGADGTRLGVNVIGSDSVSPVGGSGGVVGRSDEFILKQNEQYLVKFTAEANDTRVSNCFKWYEV